METSRDDAALFDHIGHVALDFQSESSSEGSLDLAPCQVGDTAKSRASQEPRSTTVESQAKASSVGILAEDAASSDDGEHATLGANDWEPGVNAGAWVSRKRALVEQAQVLLCNVYLVARRLPRDLAKNIAHHFNVLTGTCGSLALRIAASFLCVSPSRVWRACQGVEKAGWTPVSSSTAQPEAQPNHPAHEEDNVKILVTLVRAAVATCGHSYEEFERHLARLAAEGVNIGSKYHHRGFAKEAQFLAARCLQYHDLVDLRRRLPGLGIRSSMALLADGVPVGGVSAYGRHGNVTVVCTSSVSSFTGRLHSKFLTWVLPAAGHGGDELASSMLQALQEHGVTVAELRSCLSCIGGDGAMVRGGPSRTSATTSTAEIIWRRVFGAASGLDANDLPEEDQPLGVALGPRAPQPRVARERWLSDGEHLHVASEWDKFHREDLALTRAIHACALAEELFAICTMLDHWFHLAEGRLLLRAAAGATNSKVYHGGLPGLSRKAVALSEEPGHLLDNLPAYVAAMHAKLAYKRAGHSQKTTVGSIVSGGRRLASLDFVVFTTVFRDIMRKLVAPWSLMIQKSDLEPWALQHFRQKHQQQQAEARISLVLLREFVRLIFLLQQHVGRQELRCFVSAWCFGLPQQMFPTWFVSRREANSRWLRPRFPCSRPCPQHDQGESDAFPGSQLGLSNASSLSPGSWIRQFPTFMTSCNNFLLPVRNAALGDLHEEIPARFRTVELLSPAVMDERKFMLLGPHCQCHWLEGPRRRPNRFSWQPPNSRRTRYLPTWVRNTDIQPHVRDTFLPAPLRTHVRSRDTPPLRGLPNLWPTGHPRTSFRNRIRIVTVNGISGTVSRCQLPSSTLSMFKEVDGALTAASVFLQHLVEEEEKLLGSEGANAGYNRVIKAVSKCFDFSRMVHVVPTAEDVKEFGFAAKMLLPYLRHTEWPSSDEFPDVRHAWPSVPHLQIQYVMLMSRLRQARLRRSDLYRAWWTPKKFRVEPLVACTAVVWCVSKTMFPGIDSQIRARPAGRGAPRPEQASEIALMLRVASKITEFMNFSAGDDKNPPDFQDWGEPTTSAPSRQVITISLNFLARPGFDCKGRKRPQQLKRQVKEMWAYPTTGIVPGCLGVLLVPGRVGHIVHVQEIVRDLDWGGISAAIDCNPYFARDGPGRHHAVGGSAWHAVKIHNQARTMAAPEACCEQVGSLMHNSWDGGRHIDVGALMDIVRLQEGQVQCIGGARDDMLCHEVAVFLASLNMKPIVDSRTKRRRMLSGSGLASHTVANRLHDEYEHLKASGRLYYFEEEDSEDEAGRDHVGFEWSSPIVGRDVRAAVRARRQAATPSMQMPQVQQALDMGQATLSRLPTHYVDPRVAARPRADSIVKDGLQQWLQSDEGKKWLELKRARQREAFGEDASTWPGSARSNVSTARSSRE